MRKKTFLVVGLVLVSFVVMGLFPSLNWAKSSQLKRIVITAGPTGGTWYPGMAAAANILMKAIPGLEATVIEGGAISNIRVVGVTKDAHIGLTSLPYFYNALAGTGAFKQKITNVLALFTIEEVSSQWITLADLPINDIEDLIDKRIGLGRMGFAGEKSAKLVLEAAGLTYDKIRNAGGKVSFMAYSEFPSMIRDGHIDVFSFQGPYPHPTVIETQAFKKIKAIPVRKEIIEKVAKAQGGGFFESKVPPGVYNNKEPISFLGTTNLVIARRDIPKELAYKITKAIIENKQPIVEVNKNYDFISKENAMRGLEESMMHPGALEYLKGK